MLVIVLLEIVKRIPLFFSTIVKHLKHGPPQPSWDLKVHLAVAIIGTLGSPPYREFTIEDAQGSLQGKIPINIYKVPSDLKLYEINIPHEYRINAQAYIEKLVKPYNIVIDPIWKTPRDNDIKGDLIMNKDWNEENDWEKEKIVLYFHGGAYCAGSAKSVRELCCKLSRTSGARIFPINYRLAPQNPFPGALCDCLATYLYLMNPPKDSGFKPYKPEQIVLCGDSAGGGLAVSLGLAIRDLGLPLPAGIVALVCLISNKVSAMKLFFFCSMNLIFFLLFSFTIHYSLFTRVHGLI